jgi:hypothetical protein
MYAVFRETRYPPDREVVPTPSIRSSMPCTLRNPGTGGRWWRT